MLNINLTSPVTLEKDLNECNFEKKTFFYSFFKKFCCSSFSFLSSLEVSFATSSVPCCFNPIPVVLQVVRSEATPQCEKILITVSILIAKLLYTVEQLARLNSVCIDFRIEHVCRLRAELSQTFIFSGKIWQFFMTHL